jgi:hypothetical protein
MSYVQWSIGHGVRNAAHSGLKSWKVSLLQEGAKRDMGRGRAGQLTIVKRNMLKL